MVDFINCDNKTLEEISTILDKYIPYTKKNMRKNIKRELLIAVNKEQLTVVKNNNWGVTSLTTMFKYSQIFITINLE